MKTGLRLAVVQANPVVGDVAGNLDLAKHHLLVHKDADLVVFTECFLSGYPLEDFVRRPGFRNRVREAVDDLARFLRELGGPAALIGAPIDGEGLPLNAALLIAPDGSVQSTVKRELPNTDVFDEVRTFAAGPRCTPLQLGDFMLGVGICEDMWHDRVASDLAVDRADVLIFLNGSPFEAGKHALRVGHAEDRVRETALPLIYANQVGGQDEFVFDGASFALNRHRKPVVQLPAFAEGFMRLRLSRDENGQLDLHDEGTGFCAYPDRLTSIYSAAMLSLRDYARKNGFFDVVLGLSGGLDSALVAAIAADALGAEHVHCRMMPSSFTSNASVEDAAACATMIGAEHRSISIGPAIGAYRTMLAEEFAGRPRDATEENIQARVRGMTLMALSNKFGWLVLATGNKSETAVGYATLYGDTCGGYAPLKDIYKSDVFALARWRNANRPLGGLGPDGAVIPERIVTKAPTAELSEGQTDEQALGGYDRLDAVLEGLIERELDPHAAAASASAKLSRPVDPDYAVRIARLVKSAEWKRRQGPIGPKLTPRPFGKGWRYPITNRAAL